jgi:hypothetical protein
MSTALAHWSGTSTIPADPIAENDVTKAYTPALGSITEIPIFNELDALVPYDGSATQPLSLYAVAYFTKAPSFIKKVDYQEAIDELFKMSTSPDSNKDTYIKKLVANVNIGLLEKCFSNKSRGFLFQDLGECQHCQAKMG